MIESCEVQLEKNAAFDLMKAALDNYLFSGSSF